MRDEDSIRGELRSAAQAFIAEAIPVLHGLRLFPAPRSRPHIHIGEEYFGSEFRLVSQPPLEAAIQRAHPRFEHAGSNMPADFAGPYAYALIEACVARLAFTDDPWLLDQPAVEQTIEQFLTAVLSPERETASCRVVSHFRTFDDQPMTVGDVTVVPVACEPADHRGTLRQILNSVIEGTGVVMHRSEASEMFAPPEAVLIALARTSDEHETGFDLRRKVGSVVHAARLLHAGTSQSMYEVSGETSFVRRSSPVLHVFDGHTGLMSWTQQVRRDVVLMPGDPARIAGIEDLIRSADRPRPDVSIQSFALATGRFEGSFQAVNPYDQVVDLMTALEGAMGGANANEVLLRLRTRCAALLAAANDPAAAIFEDIGTLYKLRSTLVHGGEMKAKELTKLLRKVSGAVDGVSFLEAFGYAVDRLRDLVRRSLLVRICLGSGQDPVWPIDSDEGIDSGLSDDATRVMWRTAWHDKLRSIDAEAAALRPAVADSYLATFGKNPPTSLPR